MKYEHRVHQNSALAGIKKHARTPRSDAFPYTWRTCEWF